MLKPTTGKLRYTYKTVPFSHQKKALNKLLQLKGKGGLLMEMGTGKTKVAIDWIGIGHYNWGVRKVLVVAPLSVLGVWPRQIRTHAPYPYRCRRLEGDTAGRIRLLRQVMRNPLDNGVDFLVINYEGIWRETAQGTAIKDLLIRWAPDVIVFDESHRLKRPTSKQSRTAARISANVPEALMLTGTHITKSPMDAFGQFRAVDTSVFGTNWKGFREYYGIWGGFNKYMLKGYRHVDELVTKVRQHSYRIKKEQCLDLPPKLFETVPVTLSDRTRELYLKMAREMVIEIEETHATAAIILVKLLRLSQITNGFVKDVEGKVRVFDNSKLNTCMDLVGDLLEEEHKVVIFARFRNDIERLAEKLQARKVHYAILSGSVPPTKRDSLVEKFHDDVSLKVFIAQIQAGSLGIDLTPADAAIFYSLDYNAANYWQAQDRLHRIGQDKKVTYYHLVAPRTIDQTILQILEQKGEVAEAVLHNPRKFLGLVN